MKMALYDIGKLLRENTYPGRGIIIGMTGDGKKAAIVYFIMGRSENSRNRIFERTGNGMRTRAYDESKLTDPSLIIYNPFLSLPGTDIITNGDQTDTVYNALLQGGTFEGALMTRESEPDAPNYTPRISGIVSYGEGERGFTYELSILKSGNGDPSVCNRYFFRYVPRPGYAHFIHTYKCDGNPIPSFYGEPEEVSLPDTAEEAAELIWNSLNADNRVSLFVRYLPLDGGEPDERIINRNN